MRRLSHADVPIAASEISAVLKSTKQSAPRQVAINYIMVEHVCFARLLSSTSKTVLKATSRRTTAAYLEECEDRLNPEESARHLHSDLPTSGEK